MVNFDKLLNHNSNKDELLCKHHLFFKTHNNNISHEIANIVKACLLNNTKITLAMLHELRTNSYEQEIIYPLLDNNALAHTIKTALNNCSQYNEFKPATTYDEALIHLFIPLLLSVSTKLQEENAAFIDLVGDLRNMLDDKLAINTIDNFYKKHNLPKLGG